MLAVFAAIAVCIRTIDRRLEEGMREHRISENTYRLNRALLRSLIVQMATPFCCIAVSIVVAFVFFRLGLPGMKGALDP
jgi:Serpentine type 7TM GPCR chemoreceptor Sri